MIDHVATALALLPSQYRTLPGIVAWVTAICNRLNEIEAAEQDLINLTPLSVAVGVQLDGWGSILNTLREGRDDSTYRFLLYERLAGFNSMGTLPEMEALFAVFMGVGAVLAYEPYMAEFWLDTNSIPVPIGSLALVRQALIAAKPAGVQMFLMEESALPYFGLAEDLSPDSAGFTDSGGVVGGTLANTF